MDTLCESLADRVKAFSVVNRTRCFAHILNLVAKSLLKQFDVEKKTKDGRSTDDDASMEEIDLSEGERDLLELADGIDEEELTTAQENDPTDEEDGLDDDEDGWVDELEALSEEERANLKAITRPVSRTLVKARDSDFFAYLG